MAAEADGQEESGKQAEDEAEEEAEEAEEAAWALAEQEEALRRAEAAWRRSAQAESSGAFERLMGPLLGPRTQLPNGPTG